MKPSEVLTEAKRLLVEKGWTQHASARNVTGGRVGANDESAVCFCSVGAVIAAAPNLLKEQGLALSALEQANLIGHCLTTSWNDDLERTKEEVLEAFDKAIGMAKDKENEDK